MANNILAQIANPNIANIPGAIQAGQQMVDQRRLGPQKANLLQQQLLDAQQSGRLRSNQETRTTQQFNKEQQTTDLKELTYDIMSAFSIGPGVNRNEILEAALKKAPEGSATQKVIQDLIATPEDKKDEKFVRIINSAQQKGLLPQSQTRGSKTPKQIDTALGIEQQKVDIAKRRVRVSESKQLEGKEEKISNLQRMLNERQELIASGLTEDDFEVQAFDSKLLGVDVNMVDLSDSDVDTIANIYTLTGKMPPMGRGNSATRLRARVLKSAAQQLQGGEKGSPKLSPIDAALRMVGQTSDTKAIQGSLNFLDKQVSSMGSFVTNMNSQIDEVSLLAKDLKTFDTRLLNVPLRALRGRLKGSALQAKYDLYLSEIESEMGKLSSGSTGSIAELSEGARVKWEKIHDKALSVADMLELLEETKKAANFRLQSVQDQLDATRNRMRRNKKLPDDFARQNKDPLGIR